MTTVAIKRRPTKGHRMPTAETHICRRAPNRRGMIRTKLRHHHRRSDPPIDCRGFFFISSEMQSGENGGPEKTAQQSRLHTSHNLTPATFTGGTCRPSRRAGAPPVASPAPSPVGLGRGGAGGRRQPKGHQRDYFAGVEAGGAAGGGVSSALSISAGLWKVSLKVSAG